MCVRMHGNFELLKVGNYTKMAITVGKNDSIWKRRLEQERERWARRNLDVIETKHSLKVLFISNLNYFESMQTNKNSFDLFIMITIINESRRNYNIHNSSRSERLLD